MSARTPFNDLPAQSQAGILCNTTQFQDFAAKESGFPKGTFGHSATAEYLRKFCGIDSRREFETNETACEKLAVLRTEYDAWRGAIPTAREF
ncbi:hypothetical protein [Falsiruegeria mediterranea]|uniref:Uncharacterized protein n=1 Tax=Falsiruegeria mediterranea M17 TaxID=1200281 RepID=A0A2R8C5C6_9RHOB|nr:hypothetical protein [Falsiruegeria mediterranea]SPJ27654.1 hypothetical protein TRM7615_01144 [Falsiruegeria mediterranea M17]